MVWHYMNNIDVVERLFLGLIVIVFKPFTVQNAACSNQLRDKVESITHRTARLTTLVIFHLCICIYDGWGVDEARAPVQVYV